MSPYPAQLPMGATALQRVCRDPAELFTVEGYWTAFDEPIELLTDPAVTFALDTACLTKLCKQHRIPYRKGDSAFPVWLFREYYRANS